MTDAPASAAGAGRVRRLARRTALTAPVFAAPALLPDAAAGHGLAQRADLPIPEWLFAWAAIGVLVASFAGLALAWRRPLFERLPWRPLAAPLGRGLTSRAVAVAAGAAGVALLTGAVVAGYAGSQEATDNLTPTLVLIVFWVGLAFISVVFGDVFRALNPWRALGRVAGRLPRVGAATAKVRRPYPARLGHWPAAAGLLAFAWIELASSWAAEPDRLATAIVVYTAVTLVAMAVYGVETWSERGEAFSVYFGVLARMSVLELRGRRLGLRPPVAGLAGFTARPGTVALLAVMIGGVTFDGLSQGAVWRSVSVDANDLLLSAGLPIEAAVTVSSTLGLLACVALVAAFYRLGVAGAASVTTGPGEPGTLPAGDVDAPTSSAASLSRAFAHALVPIAFAYVVAHYLTYLLFEGQAIGYLASDPLGRGWDLFGTASATIDFTLISQTTAWYIQVAAILAGHVAGLALAHDRALVLMPSARAAVRSQYWLLAVMVGFTTLALWLIGESTV